VVILLYIHYVVYMIRKQRQPNKLMVDRIDNTKGSFLKRKK